MRADEGKRYDHERAVAHTNFIGLLAEVWGWLLRRGGWQGNSGSLRGEALGQRAPNGKSSPGRSHLLLANEFCGVCKARRL